MKFRTKMIISFSFIAFILSSFLGVVHYRYSYHNLMDMDEKNMEIISSQMKARLSESMDSMKQASEYILSNMDMLSAMQILPTLHERQDDYEIKQRVKCLQSGVTTTYMIRNFYRTIVFNEFGDVASSSNFGERNIDSRVDPASIFWLEQAGKGKGRVVLIPPHEDEWGAKENAVVYSLVRKVWGGNFGYIEIQREKKRLDEMLSNSGDAVDTVILSGEGELFYSSLPKSRSQEIITHYEDIPIDSVTRRKVSGKDTLLKVSEVPEYGLTVICSQDMSPVLEKLERSVLTALAISFGCFFVFMIMIIIIANQLTDPIRQLVDQMKNTEIENLDEQVRIRGIKDEMKSLVQTYGQMTERLNESIVKEKRLSLLQLQAQFDTLQAQVNPHFIYNVLNALSSRGLQSGDEEICEICGSLAAMLRYSTNTMERYAAIAGEVEYVKKYVYLLKSRYKHRIEVEIDCEPEIMKEFMPKLTLQQLVQNSIEHGFSNSSGVMHISAQGRKTETGWMFEVRDNGQGIAPEIQYDIEDKFHKIKKKILSKQSSIEMEIGGMGLANTYARMFLLYADRTIFRIHNLEEGVCIQIGVGGEEETECIV